MRLGGLTLLLAVLPLGLAFGESEAERSAREDLERQLKSMVGTPPTKVRIELVGIDQPNYELLEASFVLDGRSLPVPNLKGLEAEGTHLIFHGDVNPGEHRLESKLEFRNKTSQVVSAEGGFKWKPGSEVTFKAASGIEVQIKVTPELSYSGDVKNRIMLKSPATVKMLAKLDDGSMPPPAERPKLVLAEADAGVAEAVVVKGQSAAEKAAEAAEAKKKAREEALAAKQAAAEEKKQKAEEAKAARLAAAEEKQAARLAAAEEKKRAAEEAKNAKVATNQAAKAEPVVEQPVEQPAELPAEVDAGPAPVAVAEVDAGPAVVAAIPPTVPPVTPPPAEAESGLPMPVMIGIGVAVVGLLLFFLARRKKS